MYRLSFDINHDELEASQLLALLQEFISQLLEELEIDDAEIEDEAIQSAYVLDA
jgi:hypothetical protein